MLHNSSKWPDEGRSRTLPIKDPPGSLQPVPLTSFLASHGVPLALDTDVPFSHQLAAPEMQVAGSSHLLQTEVDTVTEDTGCEREQVLLKIQKLQGQTFAVQNERERESFEGPKMISETSPKSLSFFPHRSFPVDCSSCQLQDPANQESCCQ